MSSTHAGSTAAPTAGRTTVKVIHTSRQAGVDGQVLYGNKLRPLWNPDAGIAPNAGTTNGQGFADVLTELTVRLVLEEEPTAGPEAALRLTTAQADNVVADLRSIGEPLRSGLHPAGVEFVVKRLRPAAAPQLTVVHPATDPPFYWEMLYEPDPDRKPAAAWEGFWGFRHPVAHWLDENEEGQIVVRDSLLSVVCERLPHSDREVDQLWDGLTKRCANLRHERLADALGGRIPGGSRSGNGLRSHLAGMATAAARSGWLREEVKRTFEAGARDLIHFATHCKSGAGAFLTRLHFEVGGCSAELTVGDLRKAGCLKRAKSAPRPLVFLNACGTAQQANLFEPPGFPIAWILYHGALAVVATLCPVPDAFAHAFALKFYQLLFGSENDPAQPPALALMNARRYFMVKYNNPLGLAYTLYAADDAEVRFAARTGGADDAG